MEVSCFSGEGTEPWSCPGRGGGSGPDQRTGVVPRAGDGAILHNYPPCHPHRSPPTPRVPAIHVVPANQPRELPRHCLLEVSLVRAPGVCLVPASLWWDPACFFLAYTSTHTSIHASTREYTLIDVLVYTLHTLAQQRIYYTYRYMPAYTTSHTGTHASTR